MKRSTVTRRSAIVLCFLLILNYGLCKSCIQLLDGWKQMSVEERARRAQIVFHALTMNTFVTEKDIEGTYTAQFWIIDVYKGANDLAEFMGIDSGQGGVANLRDRRINITRFGEKTHCYSSVTQQSYYIIYAEIILQKVAAKYDDLFGAAADWTEENEDRVWSALGWDKWSEWSACSASCGEGTQERKRYCHEAAGCHGYNVERRRCNMFPCKGAVNPLALEDKKYFHPSRQLWEHVPGRKTAWRLRPKSYVWVPSADLFPNRFPAEFSILTTLRLHNKMKTQGTVFSLKSRQQPDAYLSLELDGPHQVKLVHSDRNGTQTVEIPANLGDGKWHQVALSIRDDSSVRSYFDCMWVSTQILRKKALEIPEDANFVIGYLFEGDLEQLLVTPNPSAVGQQCSATRIPIMDPTLVAPAITSTGKTTESPEGEDQTKILDRKEKRGHERSKVDVSAEENSTQEDTANEHKTLPLPKKWPRRKPLLPPTTQPLLSGDLNDWPLDNNSDSGKSGEDDVTYGLDYYEGSGSEGSAQGEGKYEVEWSEWSECSVTCGAGTQSRFSRCVDDGSRLELCMEAGGEKTETRACNVGVCPLDASFMPNSQPSLPEVYPNATRAGDQDVPGVDVPAKFPEIFFQASNATGTEELTESSGNPDEPSKIPVFRTPPVHSKNDVDPLGRKHKHKKPHRKYDSNTKHKIKLPEHSKHKIKSPCLCLNGGVCHQKKRSCHCPSGYFGRRCERVSCRPGCLHGGRCLLPDQCTCTVEYTGAHCETPVCDPSCENGGVCIKPGVCSCPAGFVQPRCSPICPGGCYNGGSCVAPGKCSCPPGYKGDLCEDPICHVNCLNGGRCVGPNLCTCPSGWAGPDCSKPLCHPGCRYGGECTKPYLCVCPPGTSGTFCENYSCQSECLNGGKCVGPNQCECPRNFSGATCADPVCDPGCLNGGSCLAGNRCICQPGFLGPRCDKRKCEYKPYQEPYTRGFRRLVNKKYETQCGAWGWKTCVRTKPEYQTVYKTFYRTVYKCADENH